MPEELEALDRAVAQDREAARDACAHNQLLLFLPLASSVCCRPWFHGGNTPFLPPRCCGAHRSLDLKEEAAAGAAAADPVRVAQSAEPTRSSSLHRI